MKIEYTLEGLGCANCAQKMEDSISKLPEVAKANVNFMAKKLTLEAEPTAELEMEIKRIVTGIEPEVLVIASDHAHDHDHNGHGKNEIIRLAVGFALFVLALLLFRITPFSILVFIAAYLVSGYRVLLNAARGILNKDVFNENFLMSIATIGAFGVGEYPEGVAVMLFYLVGEIFQDYAVDNSRKSIRALLDIRPDTATLITEDGNKVVHPSTIEPGSRILVKPGERIPLDGTVEEGWAYLDTAALTGESVPRRVEVGDAVLSGSINTNGLLQIEVQKSFGESTVSKILELVENASAKKAPTEQFITKFARYYTPVVVFSALALAILPPLFLEGATFQDWIYRALIFLVVSCPCALVVSIPLGFFGGIGAASKKGILVKGGNYLEALNQVRTVVFDKTGTLTKGAFTVAEVMPTTGDRSALLALAALAESHSNHPIATSIREAADKVDAARVSQTEEVAGKGIRATVDGEAVLAGNRTLLSEAGFEVQEVQSAGTVVHIAKGSTYHGYLIISDEMKPDAKEAIADLKSLGMERIVLLTGDRSSVGTAVGKELGIDEVKTELLPNQKVEEVEKLHSELKDKAKLAFVGDGINDAPVLARADIGIAMGALGSDAAIEAADIVLMTDEPAKVGTAIRIAKRTKVIVMQNIVLALGIKGLVLILSALGMATMWAAVFADVGVAVLAVLNSMRLLRA